MTVFRALPWISWPARSVVLGRGVLVPVAVIIALVCLGIMRGS